MWLWGKVNSLTRISRLSIEVVMNYLLSKFISSTIISWQVKIISCPGWWIKNKFYSASHVKAGQWGREWHYLIQGLVNQIEDTDVWLCDKWRAPRSSVLNSPRIAEWCQLLLDWGGGGNSNFLYIDLNVHESSWPLAKRAGQKIYHLRSHVECLWDRFQTSCRSDHTHLQHQ